MFMQSCQGQYSVVMFLLPCHGQYSVVRIVREKMLRTEAFSDPEQLQAFLSQLYVFLVDEMHVALNKARHTPLLTLPSPTIHTFP